MEKLYGGIDLKKYKRDRTLGPSTNRCFFQRLTVYTGLNFSYNHASRMLKLAGHVHSRGSRGAVSPWPRVGLKPHPRSAGVEPRRRQWLNAVSLFYFQEVRNLKTGHFGYYSIGP
jgi:hypothetical protein